MKWAQYGKKMAEKDACYRRFVSAIRTDATLATYAFGMRQFMDHLVLEKIVGHNEDYAGLVGLEGDRITDILEGYICMLKPRVKPSTIRVRLAPVELFLEMNRKTWYKKIIRRSFGGDEGIPGGRTPITDEELGRMLEAAGHLRDKALVHFMASTGARPSALVDPILRIKHLKHMPNPARPAMEPEWCYGVRIYAGSREEYWAFLTPEAAAALDRYFEWRRNEIGEVLDVESPVFSTLAKVATSQHLGIPSVNQIIGKCIQGSGMERVKNGHRFDKAINYMFRKRFNTKLKLENSVNSNVAEKLMAHKRGLDGTYMRPTREECYAEFVKAIPALTIDPAEREKIRLGETDKAGMHGARYEEIAEKAGLVASLARMAADMESAAKKSA